MTRPKSVLELRSEYWRQLSPLTQVRWVERAFRYWRKRGFPYNRLNLDAIRNEFSRLCEIDPGFVVRGHELRACTLGLRLANYFHPHMWRLQSSRYRSPWHAFANDDLLRLCIRKALTHCDDRLPLAPNSLRRQLQSLTNTASVWNFRPAVARALMQMYSRNGDTILDFCAGFGGRLLAALSLNRRYIGIEPSLATLRGLKRMAGKLSLLAGPRAGIKLLRGRAEKLLRRLPSKSVGLVLTSPPYFDRERYMMNGDVTIRLYADYEAWCDKFLRVTIEESARLLRPGGKLILNVADTSKYPIARDTQRIAADHFHLCEVYKLRIPIRSFQRRQLGRIYRYEPVFVFER